MSIKFFGEDVSVPKIKKRVTSSWIKETILSEGCTLGEISFIFCSDNYLLDVNRNYLNHDYYTDIITFDYVENDIINGDIFISVDRVKDNSRQYGVGFSDELNRIMIHGVLHLLGYKDKEVSEKQEMTSKEDFYLRVYSEKYLI